MIGIAAGASGKGTNNLGDIYTSTQTYFNTGLKDRVISAIINTDDNPSITYGETTITGNDAYFVNIYIYFSMYAAAEGILIFVFSTTTNLVATTTTYKLQQFVTLN